MNQILREYEDALVVTETRLDDFESPSWPQKQAFRNGQRAAYRKVKELLSFLEGD